MSLRFNVFSGTFDFVTTDINQVKIGDADTYYKWVAPDTLQLWVNGNLVHSWTAASTGNTGKPMGLLLSLTYAA
jgi:hypothetical protein